MEVYNLHKENAVWWKTDIAPPYAFQQENLHYTNSQSYRGLLKIRAELCWNGPVKLRTESSWKDPGCKKAGKLRFIDALNLTDFGLFYKAAVSDHHSFPICISRIFYTFNFSLSLHLRSTLCWSITSSNNRMYRGLWQKTSEIVQVGRVFFSFRAQ